jgi:1-acyl-sn-glycerol-3-phosphate acyltransferase
VLPFRRGLFHSVLNEGVPLRLAALRYSLEDVGGSVEDVCWWGDALLAPHLWRLLGLKGIKAEICFGGEVRQRRDRFVLSEGARGMVVEMYARSGLEGAREAELVEAL